MNPLKMTITALLGFSLLLILSGCGHPPDLIPEGIYGHPSDDDQFEAPDNLTPIDFVDENGQSRRKGT